MATKNPIQEAPIQSVSAPRAEPRAAQMIIPRRDLLTGGALVLAGSVSGCAASTARTGGDDCGCIGKPQGACTQFIADFTDKFIGDHTKLKPRGQQDYWPEGSRIWPSPTVKQTPDQIAADFGTFATVLMAVGYVGQPPTIATLPNPTLGNAIVQWLTGQSWPPATPTPTPPYDPQLVEIAVILDRLLQAINSYGNYALATSGAAASGAAAAASGVTASAAAAKTAAGKIVHWQGSQWPPH